MIPARLIKEIEARGFYLNFPTYSSNEKLILEILKQNNERLNLAIPLILKEGFDYNKIIKETPYKEEFKKIILIAEKIFRQENINTEYISKIISKNNIKGNLSKEKINYYHENFNDSIRRRKQESENELIKEIKTRKKLNINKSLKQIFSPGKRRIMEKIFNHEDLTNTELKYYYRAIRPLILAISNEDMRNYLKIIESTKKHKK